MKLDNFLLNRLREEFPEGTTIEEAANVCEIGDSELREMCRKGRKTRRGFAFQLWLIISGQTRKEGGEE